MADSPIAISPSHPARMKLEPYTAEIRIASLALGTDNIHYDVFLSQKFVEQARKYLSDLVRQAAKAGAFFGVGAQTARPPDGAAFRRVLTDLLQTGLTRAKFVKNIEVDLLLRLALAKFLTLEISAQFANLLVECKERIRNRGEDFERSQQAHVMRSRIAELQADRRNVIRLVGQTLFLTLKDIEELQLARARRALFGDECAASYEMLTNRLLLVDGGHDDFLLVEHYVLLGNFSGDPDRLQCFDAVLLEFLEDFVLVNASGEDLNLSRKSLQRQTETARGLRAEILALEEEQVELQRRTQGNDELFGWLWRGRAPAGGDPQRELSELENRRKNLEMDLAAIGPELDALEQRTSFLNEEHLNRLGDYLNDPMNARRLFDARAAFPGDDTPASTRDKLLEEWLTRLGDRELLVHVLASYEVRNLAADYCPPIHLQQLKKALVFREEMRRVEQILQQYPAKNISLRQVEESSRALRRTGREEAKTIALRFAEDFMRLRRDRRNYQHVCAWMDRIQLLGPGRSRDLSRDNRSLYEFLLPDEAAPEDNPVVSHAVIKADIRGSTGITRDLLARGLNPASFFSKSLHEPVKRLLEKHGAAKVFIEGDAIILAIYETESTRATQRVVARASVLAREILAAASAGDPKAAGNLPQLELGVGVAFQNSPPAIWMDGDSRIMISKALNLSDRLSGCSKVARRLLADYRGAFNLYLLQTMMTGSAEEEAEDLVLRYNLNGIELNEEGFQKLSEEISLLPFSGSFTMPWGRDRADLYFGEVPFGDVLEPLVIRKGIARLLLPEGKIGGLGSHAYYEICTHPKLLEIARNKFSVPNR
ncbi:MAG: hypothetical protein ACRD50_05965 [Candidatus Acidiferrales bacterium]